MESPTGDPHVGSLWEAGHTGTLAGTNPNSRSYRKAGVRMTRQLYTQFRCSESLFWVHLITSKVSDASSGPTLQADLSENDSLTSFLHATLRVVGGTHKIFRVKFCAQ